MTSIHFSYFIFICSVPVENLNQYRWEGGRNRKWYKAPKVCGKKYRYREHHFTLRIYLHGVPNKILPLPSRNKKTNKTKPPKPLVFLHSDMIKPYIWYT